MTRRIKGKGNAKIPIKTLIKRLEGIQTIKSVMSILKVNKQKATYYIYRLRKQGYVKTKRMSDNTRVYSISFENRLGGVSYYDIINQNSPVKIATPKIYRVYGKRAIIEESLIYAIKTKNLRTILAALALFKKIKGWKALYKLAKRNNIERQVGALYDLSKTIMRVRKMPKGFRERSLPKIGYPYVYVIEGLKSKDFKNIERMWKVHLPFNKKDLEDYK